MKKIKIEREDFDRTAHMQKKEWNKCKLFLETLYEDLDRLAEINKDQKDACLIAIENDEKRFNKYKRHIEEEIQSLEKSVDLLENDKLRIACSLEQEKVNKHMRIIISIICLATAVISLLF